MIDYSFFRESWVEVVARLEIDTKKMETIGNLLFTINQIFREKIHQSIRVIYSSTVNLLQNTMYSGKSAVRKPM